MEEQRLADAELRKEELRAMLSQAEEAAAGVEAALAESQTALGDLAMQAAELFRGESLPISFRWADSFDKVGAGVRVRRPSVSA